MTVPKFLISDATLGKLTRMCLFPWGLGAERIEAEMRSEVFGLVTLECYSDALNKARALTNEPASPRTQLRLRETIKLLIEANIEAACAHDDADHIDPETLS